MHPQALAFYQQNLGHLAPLTVVEFGACDMNGTVRSVYPQASSWVGVDCQAGPGVDVVADAATWVTDQRFDVCVIAEVFEHTPRWADVLRSGRDVLHPGGLLVASCATGNRPAHSAVDGGPIRDGEFYENVPAEQVRAELTRQGWAEGEVIEADGVFGGDDLYVRAIR